ncbi:MAG: serine--tRNA ligase [Patescibacteria group bacterium]|nr:serine--tRNA ligase [Patescibacteria group bacterium]
MLTYLLKQIRENPSIFEDGLNKKNRDSGIIKKIVELDKDYRSILSEIEFLRAELNILSKEASKNFSQDQLEKAKATKQRIKELEKNLEPLEKQLNELLYRIPNIPLTDVPVGKDETENVVLREVGKKPNFKFEAKDYLTLVEDNWIDVKRAAKVSGTRFGYLKNEAVMIEYALVRWVMHFLREKGFIPVVPPALIFSKSMKAMGYIDEEKDLAERYYFPQDDLFLIGTAEQAIGPMHMDEVFEEKQLPLRYIAFSPCFRREAGSYGKDTKGIWRVHYFEKLEMFIFCTPEQSEKEHQLILSIEEELMQALKIPYRVIQLCSGDLANPSAKSFDIEAWLPSQNRYAETHSCSNCTDFQSQRLNIRYKSKNGLRFVHTLNGTAFAIGRILVAIIENYQKEDGSIEIPEVLKKYL